LDLPVPFRIALFLINLHFFVNFEKLFRIFFPNGIALLHLVVFFKMGLCIHWIFGVQIRNFGSNLEN
jgi:hypothetical protein